VQNGYKRETAVSDPLLFEAENGSVQPYGSTFSAEGTNFAIFSKNASAVTLCLFTKDRSLLTEIPLSAVQNKTGDVWHIYINALPKDTLYAYRMDGENTLENGNRFNPEILLLDPYAKSVAATHRWDDTSSDPYSPLGLVAIDHSFDWQGDTPPAIPNENLIIYKAHVRGLTMKSDGNHKGTFLGLIEKIPHLLELGVNAIEFLPIQEFNEKEYRIVNPLTEEPLCNYWGYSTVNFFSLMNRYATNDEPSCVVREFKTMIRELHRNGIEVILDVVFNHTGEGNDKGPVFSFKGIDNSIYYMLDAKNRYLNFSGCGNSFNCNHPVVKQLILDSLRYFVLEFHIDGFRFDLASVFTRDTDGNPIANATIVNEISEDPILRKAKLIAEPWDASGLYQVGAFHPQEVRWSEWNDKYRDAVRSFLTDGHFMKGKFATRVSGSQDLYNSRKPYSSVNFVTAHDGFTLRDLVSYNQKHNLGNGENNQDGSNNNLSWNCGVEGSTVAEKINDLRKKQMRNLFLALILSHGIPMVLMGDEYAHSKNGNNNTWCQDNDLNWFQWNQLDVEKDFYLFYRTMIAFRKQHPILQRTDFLTEKDIHWHGREPFQPLWNQDVNVIAFTLVDHVNEENLYAAFNATDNDVDIHLPVAPQGKRWCVIADTAIGIGLLGGLVMGSGDVSRQLKAKSSQLLKAL